MSADPISGKTIRWSYEDGPTKGMKFEHVFALDGTVTYTSVGQASAGAGEGERPKYEVAPVGADVWAVAYLARSGWTLTSVLDFGTHGIVSVASNEKELFVQRGTFEVQA